MFHFPRCRPPALFDSGRGRRDRPAGLPHSETHGSRAACASPWNIAACRVLLRHPLPRHPSCARKACPQKSFPRPRLRTFSMPLREAARRAGAGCPFCILCYLQSLSIFRFRLSKSLHKGNPLGTRRRNTRRASASPGTCRASLIKGGDPAAGSPTATLLRLHPSHRPYLRRLPPSRVGPAPSGMVGSHDVTGGVYKARERIQGAVADAPLLAIPASCSRVAGCNPNWGGLSRFAGPRGPAALCTRHCSTFAAPGVGAIRT